MIGVKEAVEVAKDYAHQLFEGQELQDVLLEEVELSDNERFWLITIGFARRRPANFLSDAFMTSAARYKREYKVFEIDAKIGTPRSMKIREPIFV